MKVPKRLRSAAHTEARIGSERDLHALATLHWAGYLTTGQITHLHFPSRRRAQQRLRRYFDAGLVRPHLQAGALHRETVYTLTAAGVGRLVDAGLVPEGARPSKPPRLQKLAHALAIRDAFVAFLLAERAGAFTIEDFRFDEDLAAEVTFKDAGLVPDALALLAWGEVVRAYGVELDLGTETHATLRAKFAAWRRLIGTADRGHLGPVGLLVLAPQEKRRANLERLAVEAGLDASVCTVLLAAELDAHLGGGASRGLFAPAVRSERRGWVEETACFIALSATDDAAIRPLERPTGGRGEGAPP